MAMPLCCSSHSHFRGAKIGQTHPQEITRSHKEQKPLTQYAETKKLKEYRHWLLAHKSTSTAMEKLLTVALDDDHNGQMQALKILADRILPLSGFASRTSTSVRRCRSTSRAITRA